MTEVSDRLWKRIQRDFPAPGSADEAARLVSEANGSERVQAAIVLWAGGNLCRLRSGVALSAVDWRDVLVRGGLADEDWEDRLDAELGPTR